MRLPVPGPRDLLSVLERGAGSVEQLLGAVPRMVSLVGDAERLLVRANTVVDDIGRTRQHADTVVAKTETVVDRANVLVAGAGPLTDRLGTLLDSLEPTLVKLQPTLERLAETTDPHEVDALVQLIDQLPRLAEKLETEIMPILDTMSSVAPDLHDLLEVSRELNEMLEQVPGISRMKRRIDREQAEEGRG
jgi:ABC-type transporter Mla subunit MlaD